MSGPSTAASSGWLARLKAFDLYRDVPRDLTEQTLTGAVISTLALLFIAYLFFSELVNFLTPKIEHTMSVESPMIVAASADFNDHYDRMTIHMDISVYRLPCAVISVDAQDIMGSHVMDVGGELHKTRLDAAGNIRYDGSGTPMNEFSGQHTEQRGEGCRVNGTMIVKKVPGNFHISAHAHADLIGHHFPDGQLNVSHFVHSLWFGNDVQLQTVENAVVNPLSGLARIDAQNIGIDGGGSYTLQTVGGAGIGVHRSYTPKSYEYYLKIVPSTYTTLSGDIYEAYQYVAHSNSVEGRYRISAVYFRYDIEAITVQFTAVRRSLAHFLVQICAIIGGVFTVLGIINMAALNTVKRFKSDIGKLG
ncbi:unnamed protein product [Sphagnum balticum]